MVRFSGTSVFWMSVICSPVDVQVNSQNTADHLNRVSVQDMHNTLDAACALLAHCATRLPEGIPAT